MTLQETRQFRINKLKATLIKAKDKGKKVDKDKLLAVCCFEWGCSRRTFLEYYNVAIQLI